LHSNTLRTLPWSHLAVLLQAIDAMRARAVHANPGRFGQSANKPARWARPYVRVICALLQLRTTSSGLQLGSARIESPAHLPHRDMALSLGAAVGRRRGTVRWAADGGDLPGGGSVRRRAQHRSPRFDRAATGH
jgi:hypothetical protein